MKEETRVAKRMEKDIKEVCLKRSRRFCAKRLCSECKIRILAELGYRKHDVRGALFKM